MGWWGKIQKRNSGISRSRSGRVSKSIFFDFLDSTFRKFKVFFEAEVDPDLGWEFTPLQSGLEVNAAESAMMFYEARNPSSKPMVGIALYSAFPEDVGYYFSKI